MYTLADVFGAEGPLACRVAGFSPRREQRELAAAISEAIESGESLITEAGTGIGKTYAYLVPAVLSGNKVIISTGTKNLQDQLFERDLPVVREALGVPFTSAILKGRGNYLCLYRMECADLPPRQLSSELSNALALVRDWNRDTHTGDVAEIDALPEDAAVWPLVTSTADNCLGQECPRINDCYVVKARRRAQEAEILVINHHLLFADMALKDEGFGRLLPGANAIVIDEAHQILETAPPFFGVSVSSRQFAALVQDLQHAISEEAPEARQLAHMGEQLQLTVAEFQLACGESPQRQAWLEIAARAPVVAAAAALKQRLENLHSALSVFADRGKSLRNCCQRCADIQGRLTRCLDSPDSGDALWLDLHARSFVLNRTPMDIAPMMRARMQEHECAWVMLSATMTIGGSFEHFAGRLGMETARTSWWGSPFDYQRNALLYVPPEMPDPGSNRFTPAVVGAAMPVIAASRGRTFLLFTSHRALREAAALMEGHCDYPMLVQGTAPRSELVNRFQDLGNAVLLGTSSFWEGVDVRGEALSCVIIDKLPFASPADPLQQARIAAIRRGGGDAFRDYQLPSAVILLKQGVGRLIRDVHDRGVLVLCDPRLHARGYGRIFLDSLPDMPITREIDDVRRFFAQH